MKPYLAFVILFASLQSSSQKQGYRDFIMNEPLTQSLQSLYHIKIDTPAKNKYFIDGKAEQFTFYGLPVDTLWLQTGKLNIIKAITIKTMPVKRKDFRDFNFEWTTLLNNMSNDFGSYTSGEVRYTHTIAAVWLVQTQVWLYVTMEKVYPWQKDQQRAVLIAWRKYNQSRVLDLK